MPAPSAEMLLRRQWLTGPTNITLSTGTSVLSGTLTTDFTYSMLNSGTDTVFFLQGDATASATASSNPLLSLERVELFATSGSARVAVFSSTASGTVYISRMG